MTVTHKLSGEYAQFVTCQLEPDHTIFSDATKFRWKTANVSIETRLSTPGGAADQARSKGGGLLAGALATAMEVGKRALSGQSYAFQWFRSSGGSGLVTFSGEQPGQVRVLELDGSAGWYAESRAFVCAEGSVTFDIDFTGLALGVRSREGFILEHFQGSGTLVVGGGGTLVELNPAAYGGKIHVHTGALVAFADSLRFSTERVAPGGTQLAMAAMFGGGGINLISLEGDGAVLLQSTIHRQYEEEEKNDDRTRAAGLAGAVLGR
ncbi:MAG: AIM24 family protein [Acidimicrobiales bacterium]